MLTQGEGDKAVFAEVIRGWGGIADESGEPLPFNADNLDQLAEHPGFAQAVFRAYMKASSGEASRKN